MMNQIKRAMFFIWGGSYFSSIIRWAQNMPLTNTSDTLTILSVFWSLISSIIVGLILVYFLIENWNKE